MPVPERCVGPSWPQGRGSKYLFSPRDLTLATGSSDGTVRLWDTLKGTVRHTLPTGKVRKVAFHPRGNILAVAAEDKPVTVWDVTTGGQLIAIPESQAQLI